jgi:hypothetical protein
VLDAVRQRDEFVTCITADHGEGLDYERARVHHGGRVHQDLLHVPLYFDVPPSLSAQTGWLGDRLDSGPFSGTEILPTLLALAGHRERPRMNDLSGDGTTSPAVLVAEDRRYLYFRDRFRLNLHGRYKNMSAEEKARNVSLSEELTEPPSIRAFIRYPQKLTVTSLSLVSDGQSPAQLRRRLTDLGTQLPGSPMLAQRGNRLYAFARYDLAVDSTEDHNLIESNAHWAGAVFDGGWAPSMSMPEQESEVDLTTVVEGCDPIGVVGT